MIKGLHHVGIVVADLAAAEHFAAEVLGLECTRRLSLPGSTEVAFYACGPVELEFIEVGDPSLRARRLGDREAAARIEHIAIEVEDLQQAVAAIAAVGGRFTTAAGQTAESREPLEAIGTRSLFTMPDTTGGMMLQLLQRLQS